MAYFAVAGSNAAATPAAASVTLTIPAGTNHAAFVSVFVADATVTGLTCSQGGATVTPVVDSFVKTYHVTGLTPGSVTFTPTGSGTGDVATTVTVASNVDQADPVSPEWHWYDSDNFGPATIWTEAGTSGLCVQHARFGSDTTALDVTAPATRRVDLAVTPYSYRTAAATGPVSGGDEATITWETTPAGRFGSVAATAFRSDGGPPPEGG